jgi:hypothetical protein
MKNLREAFIALLVPVAYLIGHSLAVGLGFAGLALVSLIPVGVVKALIAIGLTELAETLAWLETVLVVTDVALFLVVFFTGVAVFVVQVFSAAKDEIRKVRKE